MRSSFKSRHLKWELRRIPFEIGAALASLSCGVVYGAWQVAGPALYVVFCVAIVSRAMRYNDPFAAVERR